MNLIQFLACIAVLVTVAGSAFYAGHFFGGREPIPEYCVVQDFMVDCAELIPLDHNEPQRKV